jgi:ectoine hydroxylase-related dioxygenase (phytanoyl-CoA dioxygenase family)
MLSRKGKIFMSLPQNLLPPNAGDLIIWHHALPHGSSPNTSTVPRVVQYINYTYVEEELNKIWM